MEFNKLIEIEDCDLVARIMDEEGDAIDIEFHYDGCVHLNTEDLSYLTLNINNLDTLKSLLIDAECWYKNKLG